MGQDIQSTYACQNLTLTDMPRALLPPIVVMVLCLLWRTSKMFLIPFLELLLPTVLMESPPLKTGLTLTELIQKLSTLLERRVAALMTISDMALCTLEMEPTLSLSHWLPL